jgi:hypothetical protein
VLSEDSTLRFVIEFRAFPVNTAALLSESLPGQPEA